MITGMHAVVYTRNAEADRAFFKDVLGFAAVDAGGGWLIFAAPPSELACHPAESNGKHELYLMCDDVRAEMTGLAEKGIACGPISEERWGLLSTIRLPGGGYRITQQPIGRAIEPAPAPAINVGGCFVQDPCRLHRSASKIQLAQRNGGCWQ